MRSRQTRRLGGFLLGILLLASGGLAYAQFGFGFRGDSNAPARFAPAQFPDSGFVVCRLMYTSVRREPSGGGWRTDYPYGEINLSIRFSELTRVLVSSEKRMLRLISPYG